MSMLWMHNCIPSLFSCKGWGVNICFFVLESYRVLFLCVLSSRGTVLASWFPFQWPTWILTHKKPYIWTKIRFVRISIMSFGCWGLSSVRETQRRILKDSLFNKFTTPAPSQILQRKRSLQDRNPINFVHDAACKWNSKEHQEGRGGASAIFWICASKASETLFSEKWKRKASFREVRNSGTESQYGLRQQFQQPRKTKRP